MMGQQFLLLIDVSKFNVHSSHGFQMKAGLGPFCGYLVMYATELPPYLPLCFNINFDFLQINQEAFLLMENKIMLQPHFIQTMTEPEKLYPMEDITTQKDQFLQIGLWQMMFLVESK